MPSFVKKVNPDLLSMVEGKFADEPDPSSFEEVIVIFGGDEGVEVVSPDDAPFSDHSTDPEAHYGVLADNRLVFDTPYRRKRDEWLREHWKIYRGKGVERCRVLPDGRIAVRRKGEPKRGYEDLFDLSFNRCH